MNNKLYVFLGTYCELIDYAILEKKYYKSDISVSNSEFERMLFQGFLNIGCESIMLSAPSVGMWPISCKKILFNEKYRNKNYITCPHLTIYGIKNFSKSISLKKVFIKIVKENLNKEIVVVGCEAHKPYLKILKYAKTKYKFKTCLIVPDLPDNMIFSKNRIYTIFKKINVKNIYKLTNKYVDCFYFFTSTMCESFDLKNKKYIVREGILENICFYHTDNNRVQCTYIGKTNAKNGVDLIIEAAKMLPDFDFNIYGSGNLDEKLKNNKVKNLYYHGFIDPKEVGGVLQKSDILLSPRYPGPAYTHTSFPSKIMKYLSFAKPIITFYLPCYSESFKDIFIYPNDLTIESFVDSLKKTSSLVNTDLSAVYEEKLNKYYITNIVKDLIKIL